VRPVFVMIAGPNGAGKTTLYDREIREDYPDAEFINADRLAQAHFGHPAVTRQESELGQQLAERRRRELMAQGKSLVTESTFSHESKLALLRDAKAAGYEVHLFHVNVRNADLAVKRVTSRVGKGGHSVPETKSRERYERNQPLIREAALLADRAYIYDNSVIDENHRLALEFYRGKARNPDKVPPWARVLYSKELQGYSPGQVNPPAASFAAADALTKAQLGATAQALIARPGATYTGAIIGKTGAHTVQQIGPVVAVAHFSSKLDQAPEVGERVTVAYSQARGAKAEVAREHAAAEIEENKAKAHAFRTQAPAAVVERYPDLAGAYAALQAAQLKAASENPRHAARIVDALQAKLATRIERGQPLPKMSVRDTDQTTKPRDTSRDR